MLKKTITYENHEGETVTDDFYFNLTRMETIELNLFDDLVSVAKSEDPKRIVPTLKRIVRYSVGQKIGNQFEKSENYANWFVASDAYSELFVEIFESDEPEKAMSDFIKAVVPKNMDLKKPMDRLEKGSDEVSKNPDDLR